MKSDKRFRFHCIKTFPVFTCKYAVFNGDGQSSMCYVTDMRRGRLIAMALNRFLNSPEGEKWLKKQEKATAK